MIEELRLSSRDIDATVWLALLIYLASYQRFMVATALVGGLTGQTLPF